MEAFNAFLISRRINLLLMLIILTGALVLFFFHTGQSYIAAFVSEAGSRWGTLMIVGFAIVALIFCLLVLGRTGLRRLISGGKSENHMRVAVGIIVLLIVVAMILAIVLGDIRHSVISAAISISIAAGLTPLLLASGLVNATLGAIRFLNRPDETTKNFSTVGFGLLGLGFLLQLVYIFLA